MGMPDTGQTATTTLQARSPKQAATDSSRPRSASRWQAAACRAAGLLALAVAFSLPFHAGSEVVTVGVFVLVGAVGVTGLNVVIGFAGQVSLGQAFFMATGAYSFALLSRFSDQNLIWLAAAPLIAAAFGAAVGPIALRVEGLYLAVMTLGLVFIGQHILFNVEAISGGPAGMAFPELVVGSTSLSADTVRLGSLVLDPNSTFYYLALGSLGLCTWLTINLRRSRTGRAMFAVKANPRVAALSGIDVPRAKIAAFAYSAALGGLSGALYTAYVGYTQPAHWSLMLSIQFVAAVIIGGLGSLMGPMLGALVVFALPSLIKALSGYVGLGQDVNAGALATLVYGLLIICFLVLEPRGLAGIVKRLVTSKTTKATKATKAQMSEAAQDPRGLLHHYQEDGS